MKKTSVKNIIAVYVLFVAAFVSYFPLLLNGIINWHDDELFSLLKNIQNGSETIFSSERQSAMVTMWFWIQYLIGENGYFIYHAVSILLHAFNAVLLFYLILRLKLSIFIALVTSFIFVIHPFGVESVAFINNQTVLLSLTTIISTYLFHIEFIESGKKQFLYLAILSAIIFYGLGNPSLSLILGILGCYIILQKKIEIKITALFFGLWVIAFGIDIQNSNILFHITTLLTDSFSMLRIGFTESVIRIFFPGMQPMLVNSNLLLTQQLNVVNIIYPLVFLSIVVSAVLKRKTSPILLFGMCIVIFYSLPIFTGIQKGEILLSESIFYMSSIGWYLIAVWFVEKSIRSFHGVKKLNYFYYGITFFLLVSFMYQTHTKSTYWKNGEKFWDKCIDGDPDNVFALIKRGMYYNSQFDIKLALRSLNKAIEISPNNLPAHFSRGIVNLQAMNLPEATDDFNTVLRIDSTFGKAYFGLGTIHNLYSRYDSAIIAFSKAIPFSLHLSEIYNIRANVFGKKGNLVLALADYQKAIAIKPNNAEVYGNRALLFLQSGNAEKAIRDLNRQIAIEPRRLQARIHSGLTAILLADTVAAKLHFSNAFVIDSLKSNIYLNAVAENFLQRKTDFLLLENVLTEAIVSEKKK